MINTFGDRMKEIENKSLMIHSIPPYLPFIIQVDGSNFSAFVNGFKTNEPFSLLFIITMIYTAVDVIKKFDAQTARIHSDEISFIFKPMCTKQEYDENPLKYCHKYSGRVLKLISLISSACSVSFNKNLNDLIIKYNYYNKFSAKFIEIIKSSTQIFDGRHLVFDLENTYELINHQIWRQKDCNRNAISTYAQKYLSKKNIIGLNSIQMIEKLLELNFNYNLVPEFIKSGIFVKKIQIENINELEKHTRNKFIIFNKKLKCNFEDYQLLIDKYVNINQIDNYKYFNDIENINLDLLNVQTLFL